MTVTQFKVLCPASPEKLPNALPQGIMQGLHTLSLLWGLLTGLVPMSKDHDGSCSTGFGPSFAGSRMLTYLKLSMSP